MIATQLYPSHDERLALEADAEGRRVSHHGRGRVRRPAPLYVSWRTRDDVGDLRGKKLCRELLVSFCRGREKPGFRLVEFGVRGREIRMLVEADDTESLSRGMQGLGVSITKRINNATGRHGAAFGDRYSARELETPRQVADALECVLPRESRRGV